MMTTVHGIATLNALLLMLQLGLHESSILGKCRRSVSSIVIFVDFDCEVSLWARIIENPLLHLPELTSSYQSSCDP